MGKLFLIIRIEFSVKDEIAMCNEGQIRKVHAMQRSNEIWRWKISMRRGIVCDERMDEDWRRDGREKERKEGRDRFHPPFTHLRRRSRRLPWRCSFRICRLGPSDRAQIARMSAWAHRRSRPVPCRTKALPRSRLRTASRSAGQTWNRQPDWTPLYDSNFDDISNRPHLEIVVTRSFSWDSTTRSLNVYRFI